MPTSSSSGSSLGNQLTVHKGWRLLKSLAHKQVHYQAHVKVRYLVCRTGNAFTRAISTADFTSYDYETLRKSFITYITTYYPETFNDYIESSQNS
jgi:hypothetical protein